MIPRVMLTTDPVRTEEPKKTQLSSDLQKKLEIKKQILHPRENGPNLASGGCGAKDVVIWEVPSLTPDGHTPLGCLFSNLY